MTAEERVAGMVSQLEAVGISCLVMGGDAVRFYGLSRNTDDVDLHVFPDQLDDLPARLVRTRLLAGHAIIEGPSWRPGAFRHFRIGTLPDGREEWLEFWGQVLRLAVHDELRVHAEAAHTAGGSNLEGKADKQ